MEDGRRRDRARLSVQAELRCQAAGGHRIVDGVRHRLRIVVPVPQALSSSTKLPPHASSSSAASRRNTTLPQAATPRPCEAHGDAGHRVESYQRDDLPRLEFTPASPVLQLPNSRTG